MKYIYLFISFLFLMSSCLKDAEIALPKANPKMALSCFLTPDTPIQVIIVRVNPLYNNVLPEYPDYITNAKVYMSNGVDTIALTLEPTTQSFYEYLGVDFKITGGQKYWIWASAPDYPSISANTTVPDQFIQVPDISYKFSAYTQGSDSAYQVQVSWRDIPNMENYYRVQPWLIDSNSTVIGFNDYTVNFTANREYLDDKDKDGQILDFINESYNFYGAEPNRADIKSRTLVVYHITASAEYYKYHQSLANYIGDSPFANPSNRYTNIKGGYGVFSGYRMVKAYFKIF